MRARILAVLAALLAGVVALPARAHHEVGGYETSRPVVVDGVVREFVWANPHVVLYLEVPKGGSGNDVWTLEAGSVQALERNGWSRRALRRGDRVKVLLAPKRDAKRAGRILRVTESDGRVLSIEPAPGVR